MSQLPPLPLCNGILEIDNSFIEALTACPRKLQYQYLMKRRPRAEAPALSFGTAIHAALEYRYTQLKNTAPTAFDEQDIFDKVLTPYFDKNPQPEEDHRTLGFAFDVIKQYNRRYVQEPFQLMTKEDGSVLAELSFSVPLFTYEEKNLHELTWDDVRGSAIDGNPEQVGNVVEEVINRIPVHYTGRIDLPVIWDGQLIILDHKTTSTLGSFYFDGQKVSSQFEGYCWAFDKLTNQRPSGYCINAIRTKEAPARPRGSWDSWWDEGFARHKEYLRPGQLEEWRRNTCALIEQFFWHISHNYMPMHKKSCTMYGRCPYYDVCYLPEDSRDVTLRSDLFTTNEWSPLK